jgi:UDP-N-acetylglucosamine 2-epimerase
MPDINSIALVRILILMRVLSIVGARPQFVKVAPISRAANGMLNHFILHTGQHYDPMLSEELFKSLEIPTPDFHLETSREASQALQTASMLIEIEKVLLQNSFDHVIVYGDTNSTLAGALAAAKLHIPISHVEAGLRSFNKLQPEEINRIVTDHLSDLLFAPSKSAMQNLQNEGLAEKSNLVGDVMVDSLRYIQARTQNKTIQEDFIVATIHRPSNTDEKERLQYIVSKLEKSKVPVHLHCHPRLTKMLQKFAIEPSQPHLKLLPPLPYESLMLKVMRSRGVITDSGGLQKEAYILGKPCMVVNDRTEWLETLDTGSSFLDYALEVVSESWWQGKSLNTKANVFGSGDSATKILEIIKSWR